MDIPEYLNPEKVAALHGAATGTAEDVIRLAETQLGYEGSIQDGRHWSYFANVWENAAAINEDAAGNWCSEFVCWCLVQAKALPENTALTTVYSFREHYQDSLYRFYASAENPRNEALWDDVAQWFSGYTARGTLRLKDLRRGDILLIHRDSSSRHVPHHTAIFLKTEGNRVQVIEGNIRTSATASAVQYGSYEAHEVYMVLRPDYP